MALSFLRRNKNDEPTADKAAAIKQPVDKQTETAAKEKPSRFSRQKDSKPAYNVAKPIKKTKKPKGKQLTASKRKQFMLLAGDDGAILTLFEKGKLRNRLFAPSSDAASNFIELIRQHPKTPITLLVDTVEQTYVRHTLPPVTSLSLNKLVQRRIERDFKPEDYTGAIRLGRETSGRKDWQYLLLGVPAGTSADSWLTLLDAASNPFDGIVLLPVELAKPMQHLFRQCFADSASEWKLLVSHQKVGGFRQIITHKGKLVFTRMSQPLGDPQAGVISGQIEQEISSTIEYLRRLKFRDADGLDILIIAAQPVVDNLAETSIKADNVEAISPFNAAQRTAIVNAAIAEDHYGDVLLSGIISGIKLAYPLANNTIDKITKLQLMRKLARWLPIMIALGLLAYAGYFAAIAAMTYNDMQDKFTDETRAQNELNEVKSATENLPDNLEDIIDAVTFFETFPTDSVSPLPILQDLAPVIRPVATVKSMKWSYALPVQADSNQRINSDENNPITFIVELEFLQRSGSKQSFYADVRAMLATIPSQVDGYDMEHSELAGLYADQEALEVVLDGQSNPDMLDGKVQTMKLTFTPSLASDDDTNSSANNGGMF